MQSDLINSDSNEQNDTHSNQDLSNNQTQIETDVNQPVCEKLIVNFDYTSSDVIFWEQPPPYSQLSTSILPIKHYYAKNQMIVSKTFNPRNFFLISSIIYFIWGVLAFVLTIALTIISFIIPYFTLWSILLILNGAINVYVILLWSSNGITHLKRMFSFTLYLNTMCFILSAAIRNFTTSIVCLNTLDISCDSILAAYSELAYVLIFILATVHSVFNVVIVYNIDNEIMLKLLPSAV